MIKNLILIAVILWVGVYTLSYAVYEYKTGSKKAAAGVLVLCLVLCLLFAKI